MKRQSQSANSSSSIANSNFAVFQNVGEMSTAKSYHLVSLISVVSKVFKKLLHNRTVDYPEKCAFFFNFRHGFRSFLLIADLLTVVCITISRVFSRSGTTQALALDISKAFNRVWHAGLLQKLMES